MEIVTIDAACDALKPAPVTRDEFDAMTQAERNKISGDFEAWASLCVE